MNNKEINKLSQPSPSEEAIKAYMESDFATQSLSDNYLFKFDTSSHDEAAKHLDPEKLGFTQYVYALSNPMMPGVLKIGKTTRSVEQRATELSSSTGVPVSFVIESVFITEDCTNLENCIHDDLVEFRVSENREFFKCSVQQFEDVANLYAVKKGEDISNLLYGKRLFSVVTMPQSQCVSVNVESFVMERLREISNGDESVIVSGLLDFAINHYTESVLFNVDGKKNIATLFPSHVTNETEEHYRNLEQSSNG